MDIWSAALTLLIILDPLGNIPLFHATLAAVPEARRRSVIIRELFIALLVLVSFLWTGNFVLTALGLQKPTLNISGGLVLFLIAINMVFPQHGLRSEIEREDPFIVPLAIPFIAGPSAIAAVMLLASREPDRMGAWMAALSGAWAITAVCLIGSSSIMRFIGQRGLRAAEKLMGMLLIMIAVQMFLNGIEEYLRHVAAGQN